MARVTLATLKALVKDEADMANSTFLTAGTMDTTLTYWINAAVSELHDLLVEADEDYFIKLYEYTLDGSSSYALPEDFLRLNKVYLLENNKLHTVRRMMLDEIPTISNAEKTDLPDMLYYRMTGSELYILPTDVAGTLQIFYVPQARLLENPDDELHKNCPDAWAEFIVSDVVARCLSKEESDPTPALRRKSQAAARITAVSATRDAGEPKKQVSRNMQRANFWTRT